VYIAILLLVFLVPKRKCYSRKTQIIYVSLFFLLNTILLFGWLYLVKDLWVPLRPDEHTSPHDQLIYILANPIEYSVVMMRTFTLYYQFYWHQFIGVLGWLDTPLPKHIIFLYFAVLLFFSLSDNHNYVIISLKKKTIVFISVICSVILISTVLYLQWNSVAKNIIGGIQGRYFIPLSPLVFLLLHNKKFNFIANAYTYGIITLAFSSYVLTYTLYILLSRYY